MAEGPPGERPRNRAELVTRITDQMRSMAVPRSAVEQVIDAVDHLGFLTFGRDLAPEDALWLVKSLETGGFVVRRR